MDGRMEWNVGRACQGLSYYYTNIYYETNSFYANKDSFTIHTTIPASANLQYGLMTSKWIYLELQAIPKTNICDLTHMMYLRSCDRASQ